jgi:hypothetical protein
MCTAGDEDRVSFDKKDIWDVCAKSSDETGSPIWNCPHCAKTSKSWSATQTVYIPEEKRDLYKRAVEEKQLCLIFIVSSKVSCS